MMLFNIHRNMNRLTQVSKAFFTRTPQFVHSLAPDYLLSEDPKPRKRTKTVCTIGYPSTHSAPWQNIPPMQANSSMKALVWQDWISAMATMNSTDCRWWEFKKRSNLGQTPTYRFSWIPKVQRLELAIMKMERISKWRRDSFCKSV